MDKNGKIALLAVLILAVSVAAIFVVTAGGGGQAACRDHIDNDGDGQTDWPNDAGCSSKNDNDETNCGDGVVSGSEVCELGQTQSCVINGSGGTQTCNAQCTGWGACQ